ncbi:acetylesterase [Candidatus Poribacteria bacterium]|nr:acetylesterase [Candidatus Poribacteria bacterium]
MCRRNRFFVSIIFISFFCVSCQVSRVFGSSLQMNNPDFTKGGSIPEGAKHDWNLGATGARGWMFSKKLVTTEARQIAITKVEKGSPADSILVAGDIIIGVDGTPFSYDPRTEMGKALTKAESEAGRGALNIVRHREGKTDNVTLQLPILGDYSSTAPYNCLKSKRILELGCQELANRMEKPSYQQNPITRSLNALALLASGNKEYIQIVRKEARWASAYSTDSFQTWYYGYVIMFLAEYIMATGDKSFMPGLKRLSLEAADGQSLVGSWGHRFAQADGRLGGYGMMNSPGLTMTISLVLAHKAGVTDPSVENAIQRSTRLLKFYIGKGAVPYGDHRPWIQTHEDNGKCGMAAVMFNLLGEARGAEFFSYMSISSHGAERDTGHTGNFFNILWAIPSISRLGPDATGIWMKEFGAWYFDLARRWNGSYIYQGPPQMNTDSYQGWDCSGLYLLSYAMPLKKIYLTGKQSSIVEKLDIRSAESLILDGYGWNNMDRNSYYDNLEEKELLQRLSSWSPVVRERAAIALGRRKETISTQLVRLLETEDLHTRYGACQAIKMQRERGSVAVPVLRQVFHTSDLWLRILAAEALAGIGDPAKIVVPEMLTRLTQYDEQNDPRNMEQRYVSFALFDRRNGLVGKSLAGVDRNLLIQAVRSGLLNQDGRSRGSIGSVYENLTYDEIKPLLPDIYQAIKDPSPSGIMFSDVIRMRGLELFTKYRIKEGLELLVDYSRNQKKHGSEKRIFKVMEMIKSYGTHSKSMISKLESVAVYFETEEENFPPHLSLRKASVIKETISEIKSLVDQPKLIHLNY